VFFLSLPHTLYNMIGMAFIHNPRLIYPSRTRRARPLSCGANDLNLCGRMITRVNFFGGCGSHFRFRHPATSMRFATRSLPSLTRCTPVQYAPKRGLRALQCAPGLNPRLRAPSVISHPNDPPHACRRTFHTSFGEALFRSGLLL
jgi:hypothetical protein